MRRLFLFFLALACTLPANGTLHSPRCPWYILRAELPPELLAEDIRKYVAALGESLPAVDRDKLLAAVERRLAAAAGPDDFVVARARLTAVKDLLLHLNVQLALLRNLSPTSFPMTVAVEDDFEAAVRRAQRAMTDEERETGRIGPVRVMAQAITARNLTHLFQLTAAQAVSHLGKGDPGIFSWHDYLSRTVERYTDGRWENGMLSTSVGAELSEATIALLFGQRDRFLGEPGRHPLMPGMPGNFTAAQADAIAEALTAAGTGLDATAVKRLFETPFFAGNVDLSPRPVIRKEELYQFDSDYRVTETIARAYTQAAAAGEKEMREWEQRLRDQGMELVDASDQPVEHAQVFVFGNSGWMGREEGAAHVMAGRVAIQSQIRYLVQNRHILDLSEFYARYLGDEDYLDGRRWSDVTQALAFAVNLVQFCHYWEDSLLYTRQEDDPSVLPEHVDLRTITEEQAGQAVAFGQFGRGDFPEPLAREADARAVAAAESQLRELLAHPNVGYAFRNLLIRYLWIVEKMQVPHFFQFPEYVRSLRRIAGLEQ